MGIGQAQEIGVTVSLNREANRKDRRSGATIEPDSNRPGRRLCDGDDQAQSGPTFLVVYNASKMGPWVLMPVRRDHVDLDILGQPPHPHNDVSAFIHRLDGVSHEIDQTCLVLSTSRSAIAGNGNGSTVSDIRRLSASGWSSDSTEQAIVLTSYMTRAKGFGRATSR